VGQKVTHIPLKENLSSKEVGQKVAHFFEKGVKKWSTFSKGAPKSDAPI
jgi:hypothetical protein